MPEIRPIPGFDGYYAGDDGMIYRAVKPSKMQSGNRYEIQVRRDGHAVKRPLAYFVARAWLPGYRFGEGMKPRFVNGDTLDTRPENLEWKTSEELRVERNARYEENLRRKLAEDPDDPRHGTTAGYNRGCRCERCRPMWKVNSMKTKIRKTMREAGAWPE